MTLFVQVQQYIFAKAPRHVLATSLFAFSAVCGTALLAPDAMAGFQWVAPIERAPTAVTPAPAMPGQSGNTELPAPMQLPAAPEVVAAPTATVAPAVLPPLEQPVTPPVAAEATPVPVVPTEVVPVPTQAAAPTPVVAEPVVDGFGKKIPLAIALKQVLPTGYGFALDGVDPNMKVDWQGGKTWYRVLDDMLTEAKLYGREDGQIIKITPAKAHDAVPANKAEIAPTAATPVLAAANEPPVIVPPMPVLDSPVPDNVPPSVAPVVQAIESTPPAPVAAAPAAVSTETAKPTAGEVPPLVVTDAPVNSAGGPVTANAVQAAAAPTAAPVATAMTAAKTAVEPALPPIPQGELVTPSATMMPAMQPTAAEMWHAEPGDHLHAVIKKWANRAHVELVWSTEYDYPIQASINFSGSFEYAVRGLLTGFVEAKPQPYGRLHDNPAVGQRTLVIEARGNTNSD
jgi:hypothetical protein